MVKVLFIFQSAVKLIGIFFGMMGYVPVPKEMTLLSQPSHGQVEFDALVLGYGIILITKHDKQGSLDPVGKKDRRILNVFIPRFPQVTADTVL